MIGGGSYNVNTNKMEIFVKSVKNKPIVTLDTGARIGAVGEAVIDPSTGKLVAFYVKDGGWGRRKVIAAIDIREMSERLIIINSAGDLENEEEIVSIEKILASGIRIIGNRVRTTSGKYLGSASDVAIETSALMLAKLEVKTRILERLPKRLLIGYDQILKIERDAITVKDESIKEAVARAVPAAVSS